MYPATPEYLAEHARAFLDEGVSIIGGCCGTGPAHTVAIAEAIRGRVAATRRGRRRRRRRRDRARRPRRRGAAHDAAGPALARGGFVVAVEMEPPRSFDVGALVAAAETLARRGSRRHRRRRQPDGEDAHERVGGVPADPGARHRDRAALPDARPQPPAVAGRSAGRRRARHPQPVRLRRRPGDDRRLPAGFEQRRRHRDGSARAREPGASTRGATVRGRRSANRRRSSPAPRSHRTRPTSNANAGC